MSREGCMCEELFSTKFITVSYVWLTSCLMEWCKSPLTAYWTTEKGWRCQIKEITVYLHDWGVFLSLPCLYLHQSYSYSCRVSGHLAGLCWSHVKQSNSSTEAFCVWTLASESSDSAISRIVTSVKPQKISFSRQLFRQVLSGISSL